MSTVCVIILSIEIICIYVCRIYMFLMVNNKTTNFKRNFIIPGKSRDYFQIVQKSRDGKLGLNWKLYLQPSVTG